MDWLCELSHDVNIRKLELERTIKNIRLLFKPWPSQELPVPDTDNKPPGNTPDSSSNTGLDTCPVLTSEEQEGVDLVNKLLTKAQKARDVQKKLEEPKRSRVTDKLHLSQQENRLVKGNSDASNGVTGSQKSREKQSNDVKSLKPKPTTIEPCNKSQTTQASNKPWKQNAKISERPQSSFGRRKAVPAHVNAPFQTNPRLATTKLQTTYRAATTKPLSKGHTGILGARGRGTNSSTSTRGSNSAVPKGSNSASSSRSQQLVQVSKSKADGDCESNSNLRLHQQNNVTKESEASDQSDDIRDRVKETTHISDSSNCDTVVGAIQHGMDTLTLGDSQRPEATDQSSKNQLCDTHLFQLSKDGTSISLPPKLKKLMYNNRKLRQKLYTKKVTKKVNSPQTSTEFPLHIEHAFGDSEALQTQLQARQAQHVFQVYSNMFDILKSLNLDQVTADSSPSDVIRAKKLMEYLLLTFHETEQILHTSDFGLLNTAHTSHTDVKDRVAAPDHHCQSVWYHNNTTLSGHNLTPIYKYKSYRQLERYMTLVYNIQLLQLQTDLMDTSATVVLPLLKSLEPASSEFIQVLRSSYSMLSTNPNRVPVVVKDTIQDESIINCEEDDS